jgi:hypothetical protein
VARQLFQGSFGTRETAGESEQREYRQGFGGK